MNIDEGSPLPQKKSREKLKTKNKKEEYFKEQFLNNYEFEKEIRAVVGKIEDMIKKYA